MRLSITPIIVTLAALFLGSCSGIRYTSATAPQDDLYAKPGDAPLYATRAAQPQQQEESQQNSMPNVSGNQGYNDFDQQRAADAQSYYGQPQSQQVVDGDGNTYITNNYNGNSSAFLDPTNSWGSPWRANHWSYMQFLPTPSFYMPRSYFMDPWIYPYAFVAPRWGFGVNLGFGNFYGRPNWGWNQWGYGGGSPWFNNPFYYNNFYGWGGGGSQWFDPYYGIGFYNGYNQGYYNGFYNGYQSGLYGNQWGWGGSQVNNSDNNNGGTGGTIRTYGPRQGFSGTINRTLVRADDVNKRLVASQDPRSTQALRDERTAPERIQALSQAPIGGMDGGRPTGNGSTLDGREQIITRSPEGVTNLTPDTRSGSVNAPTRGGVTQPQNPGRINESQYQNERQQSLQTTPTSAQDPRSNPAQPYNQRIPERAYYEQARQNQPSPSQMQNRQGVSQWNTGAQPGPAPMQQPTQRTQQQYPTQGAPSRGGNVNPDIRQTPSNNAPQRQEQSTPRMQSQPSRSSGSNDGGGDYGGSRGGSYSTPSSSPSRSSGGSSSPSGGSSSPSRSAPSGRGR